MAPPSFPPASAQGRLRRTPPAIFPPIFGLFGLGLAWRRGAESLGGTGGLPAGLGEAILGAVTLLYLVCLAAWLGKPLRRPAVALEELRVLPGRAGLAGMTLAAMLMAATLVPYGAGLATAVAITAFAAHCALILGNLWLMARGPEEARTVTPVWHVTYVGFIIGPLAGIPLGHLGIATAILYLTIPVAIAIWAVSLWQLATRIPPPPLRPLLAIHLAPAAMFATVAAMLGLPVLGAIFTAVAAAIFLALLAAGRWITVAGFSPMWGAFTFPLAAFASALFANAGGSEIMRWAAVTVLVAATLAIPAIAAKVLQAWARGGLAERTNAARA